MSAPSELERARERVIDVARLVALAIRMRDEDGLVDAGRELVLVVGRLEALEEAAAELVPAARAH